MIPSHKQNENCVGKNKPTKKSIHPKLEPTLAIGTIAPRILFGT